MSVCLFRAGAGVRLFASQNRFVCVPISCHCVCVRLSLLTVRNLGRALRTTQRGSPLPLPSLSLSSLLPYPTQKEVYTHTLYTLRTFLPPRLLPSGSHGSIPLCFPPSTILSSLYVREKKIKVEGIFLLIDILYE